MKKIIMIGVLILLVILLIGFMRTDINDFPDYSPVCWYYSTYDIPREIDCYEFGRNGTIKIIK